MSTDDTQDDRISAIRAKHVKKTGGLEANPDYYCPSDIQTWPCDAASLLAHIDAQAARIKALEAEKSG